MWAYDTHYVQHIPSLIVLVVRETIINLNEGVVVVVLHPLERSERGGQKRDRDRHTRATRSNLDRDEVYSNIVIKRV